MVLLGLVTIGQAPRQDIVPHMKSVIPTITTHERGALDGLSAEQITSLATGESGDDTLVSRLADGSAVTLSKTGIIPHVEKAIRAVENEGVAATLLLCTGAFPQLAHNRPLLLAERLYTKGVEALSHGHLGVICPLPEQRALTESKWAHQATELTVESASPYGSREAVTEAARRLQHCDVVLLDCMGFDPDHKAVAVEASRRPTLLASSLVARVAGEFVSPGDAKGAQGP